MPPLAPLPASATSRPSRKSRFLILSALCAAALAVPAARAQSPLLLHYTFARSSVADTSGNHRDGRLSGGAKVGASPSDNYPALDNTASQMGSPSPDTGGAVRYSGPGFGPLKSFTVTLWYRTSPGQTLTQGTRLFEFTGVVPGKPLLLGAGTDHGNLSLNVGAKPLATNGTPNPVLRQPDSWVFVAAVYDGTFDRENVRLYVGVPGTRDPIHLIAVNSTPLQLWPAGKSPVQLVFGANAAGGRALAGWLGDIRIYGNASTNAAALDPVQLQAVMDEFSPSKK